MRFSGITCVSSRLKVWTFGLFFFGWERYFLMPRVDLNNTVICVAWVNSCPSCLDIQVLIRGWKQYLINFKWYECTLLSYLHQLNMLQSDQLFQPFAGLHFLMFQKKNEISKQSNCKKVTLVKVQYCVVYWSHYTRVKSFRMLGIVLTST